MDPTRTQPYTNQLVSKILQCLHGIHTWFPQATGEQTLKFLDNFFVGLENAFKPALPSNLLQHQVRLMTKSFARNLANLTIIHYRKRISDCVQQLCYMQPPSIQLHRAVGRAITKGREKWGHKLHNSVIEELTKVSQNLLYHNRRDNKYKDAHKRLYGLSCHVNQYKDYMSPFPADLNSQNIVMATAFAYYQKDSNTVVDTNTDNSHRPHPYSRNHVRSEPNTRPRLRTEIPVLIPKMNHGTNLPSKVCNPIIGISQTPDRNVHNTSVNTIPTTPMDRRSESVALALQELFEDTRPSKISSQLNTMSSQTSVTYSQVRLMETPSKPFDGTVEDEIVANLQNSSSLMNSVSSQTDETPLQVTPNSYILSSTPIESTSYWKVQKPRNTTHLVRRSLGPEVPTEPITTNNTFMPLLGLDENNSGSSTESENLLSPIVEDYPLPQRALRGPKK